MELFSAISKQTLNGEAGEGKRLKEEDAPKCPLGTAIVAPLDFFCCFN